jgi:hypothetical protein
MEDSHYDYLWTLLRNLVNFNALEVMDMNRHDRRALDAIHRKFTDNLKSDVKPYPKHEQEVLNAFFADVKKKKAQGIETYPRIVAAFGDGCADGFIEQVYEGEGDGPYFKLWGNTFLLKGVVDAKTIKVLDLSKAVIFMFPQYMAEQPFLALGLLCTALFTKKRFIGMLDKMMHRVEENHLNVIEIPEKDYHKAPREIKRAAEAVLKAKDWGYFTPLFTKFIRYVVFFLECDRAYLLRIQDAFADHGFWSGLDTLISRETAYGVGYKWKWIKLALTLTLWRYSEVKEFLYLFFDELRRDRIRMDEGDKYYSLGDTGYDFGGRPFEDRMAERERVDKERNHVYIKV